MPTGDAPGSVLLDTLIPLSGGLAFDLDRGQHLRIVDAEGGRVPNLICLGAHRVTEKASMATTRLMSGRWTLTPGMAIYSFHADPMLTVISDPVGRHHLEGGYCTGPGNDARLGAPARGPNCYDSLVSALAEHDIGAEHVQPDMCAMLFLRYTDEPDGRRTWAPASTPGAHIELRAEMELLVAVADCAQLGMAGARGRGGTPLRILVTQPR